MALTNTPEILVNGKVIPSAVIDEEVQYHPASSRREAMVKAAEAIIIAEVLSQKANDFGMLEKPNRDLLKAQPDVVDQLLEQEVDIPSATKTECLRYFEQNKEKFCTSPLVEANHILLGADPEDLEQREQMRTLAENLLNMIQNKDIKFGEAAKQYSMCPSKKAGGNLGQLSYGQTVSEFERQVFAANEGLLNSLVETRYGYHIVEVVRKVEGQPLEYDMVEDKILKYLNDKVQRKAVSQYLHRLVSEADIKGFSFNFDESMVMQ